MIPTTFYITPPNPFRPLGPLILRGGALAAVFSQKVPPLGLRGGQVGLRDSAQPRDYTSPELHGAHDKAMHTLLLKNPLLSKRAFYVSV